MPDEEGLRLEQYTPRRRDNPGQRDSYETWWAEHQPWLEELGYALRPRFQKDWQPSWQGKSKQSYKAFEDGQKNFVSYKLVVLQCAELIT